MGRGRQKAKQTKVARELKYYSPDTNLRALERELGTTSHTDVATASRYESSSRYESDDEFQDTYNDWNDER